VSGDFCNGQPGRVFQSGYLVPIDRSVSTLRYVLKEIILLIRRRPDDFLARSSDELSLAKGDRVELIERDDEFGDGWFLGKHLVNGNSGLFPEGSYDPDGIA
jgi:hypothetical protein